MTSVNALMRYTMTWRPSKSWIRRRESRMCREPMGHGRRHKPRRRRRPRLSTATCLSSTADPMTARTTLKCSLCASRAQQINCLQTWIIAASALFAECGSTRSDLDGGLIVHEALVLLAYFTPIARATGFVFAIEKVAMASITVKTTSHVKCGLPRRRHVDVVAQRFAVAPNAAV